ncbi:hypothetical protein, partial [Thalassolituus sp. UBA1505]|uniref:hypothetical protein n=1 Tax=Thalassolituus sp. UBA1505 TaxID=1947653 RepID=UPI0025CBDE91
MVAVFNTRESNGIVADHVPTGFTQRCPWQQPSNGAALRQKAPYLPRISGIKKPRLSAVFYETSTAEVIQHDVF